MADRSGKQSKRPSGFDQRAAYIGARATSEGPKTEPEIVEVPEPTAAERHASTVALGRFGRKKGGPTRAKKLTPKLRS
jgi:hypothetical protein